jgi:hypothetical protein
MLTPKNVVNKPEGGDQKDRHPSSLRFDPGQQRLRTQTLKRAGSAWAHMTNVKASLRRRQRTCTFNAQKGRSRQGSYRKLALASE